MINTKSHNNVCVIDNGKSLVNDIKKLRAEKVVLYLIIFSLTINYLYIIFLKSFFSKLWYFISSDP